MIEPQEIKVEDQGVRYNTRANTRQSLKKKEIEIKTRNICKLEDTSSVQILDSDNEEARIEIEIEVISDSEEGKMVVEEKKTKKEFDQPIASRTRGKARERK